MNMNRLLRVMCCGVLLCLSVSGLANGMNRDLLYRSPSIFNGGHFFVGISGALSRVFMKLQQTTPGFPNIINTDQTISAFAGALQVGYAFDPGYFLPLRFAFTLIDRPSHTFQVFPLLPGSAGPGGTGIHAHGRVETTQGMFDVYYDIHTGSSWTPYLGIGLGAIRNSTVYRIESAKDVVLSSSVKTTTDRYGWSGTAGVSTEFSNNFLVDVFLRFNDLGRAQFASATQTASTNRLYAVDIGFGVQYIIAAAPE